jgi:hypothetical protein
VELSAARSSIIGQSRRFNHRFRSLKVESESASSSLTADGIKFYAALFMRFATSTIAPASKKAVHCNEVGE